MPPILLSPTAPETTSDSPSTHKKDRLNGGQGQSVQQSSGGQRIKAGSAPSKSKLEPEASAALRDQLAAELKTINSAEGAATWAHRVMSAPKTL